ncbi:MAG: hypothetical protein ACLFN2_08310, partial [Bacteroidales bacterium]
MKGILRLVLVLPAIFYAGMLSGQVEVEILEVETGTYSCHPNNEGTTDDGRITVYTNNTEGYTYIYELSGPAGDPITHAPVESTDEIVILKGLTGGLYSLYVYHEDFDFDMVNPPSIDEEDEIDVEHGIAVSGPSEIKVDLVADPEEICEGGSIEFQGNPSGGTEEYISHWWSGTGDYLNDNEIESPTLKQTTPPGVYTYTYTVTDSNNCSMSGDIVVMVHEEPDANAGSNDYSCSLPEEPKQYSFAATPSVGTGTWSYNGSEEVTFGDAS